MIEAAWPPRPGVEVKLRDRSSRTSGGGSEEKEERSFVLRLYGRDSQFLMDAGVAARPRSGSAPARDRQGRDPAARRHQGGRSSSSTATASRSSAVRPEVLQGMVSSGLQGRMLTEFEEDGRETALIAEFDSERNPRPHRTCKGNAGVQQRHRHLPVARELRWSRSASSNPLAAIERTDGRTHVTHRRPARTEGVGPAQLSRQLDTRDARAFRCRAAIDLVGGQPVPRDSQAQMDELAAAGGLGIVLVFLADGRAVRVGDPAVLDRAVHWCRSRCCGATCESLFLPSTAELDAMAVTWA